MLPVKTATIRLPYFKQGDDLAHFLRHHAPPQALLLHASLLDGAAAQLRNVADLIGDANVEFYADNHYIGLSGPDDLIDRLVAAGLAEVEPNDEEDDDHGGEDAARA
jgi:hypothetical protein